MATNDDDPRCRVNARVAAAMRMAFEHPSMAPRDLGRFKCNGEYRGPTMTDHIINHRAKHNHAVDSTEGRRKQQFADNGLRRVQDLHATAKKALGDCRSAYRQISGGNHEVDRALVQASDAFAVAVQALARAGGILIEES